MKKKIEFSLNPLPPFVFPAVCFLLIAALFINPRTAIGDTDNMEIFHEGVLLSVEKKANKGIINIGEEHGVKRGDRLVVIRPGKKVEDPRSGKLIAVEQTVIGEVKVISTSSAVSDVKLTRHGQNMKQGDLVRRRTSAPHGVEARAVGFRKIEILWAAQREPEIKLYKIYRSDSEDGPFSPVGTERSSVEVMFTDKHSSKSPMEDNKRYYYQVAAFNRFGVPSSMSEVVSAVTPGAPSYPEGLTAESGQIRFVTLRWTPHPNKEVSGYRLYRGEAEDGPYEMIYEVKKRDITEYVDRNNGSESSPGLQDSKTYFYKITALSPFGDEGLACDPVKATTADPPSVPTGLTVEGWRAGIAPIKWDVHPDKTVRGYLIFRANRKDGPYVKVVDINDRESNSYVDGGREGILGEEKKLENAHLYFYRILAYNIVGSYSQMSEPVSIMTKPVPSPTENLVAISGRPRQVPLAWRKNPEVDIKEYHIYRADSKDGEFRKIAEVTAQTDHYLDKKLKDNHEYRYKIRAIDSDNLEGEFSKIVTATTKSMPSAITGFTWTMENDRAVLQWDRSEDVDIKEYHIYRKSFFGWKKVYSTSEPFFILDMKKGDSDDYSVSAIDSDNLEGPRSDPLTVTIQK